jgi:hypothetical protein
MMTAEDTRYSATMAWVEQLVADSPKLQSTKHEFYTLAGQLWVQVQGGHWEAHAWQVAVGGMIRPSYVDGQGVFRQMILGTRVCVEVIDDPQKRPQRFTVVRGTPSLGGWVIWDEVTGSYSRRYASREEADAALQDGVS